MSSTRGYSGRDERIARSASFRSRSPQKSSRSRRDRSRSREYNRRRRSSSNSRERHRGRGVSNRNRDRDGYHSRSRRSVSRSNERRRNKDDHTRKDRSEQGVRFDSKECRTEEVLNGTFDEYGERDPAQREQEEDENELNEVALQEVEEFLMAEEESENEDEKERRLIEERRKRREEILKKHTANGGAAKLAEDANHGGRASSSVNGHSNEARPEDTIFSSHDGHAHAHAPGMIAPEVEAAALEAEREAVQAEEDREAATIAVDIFSSSPSEAVYQHPTVGRRATKAALLEGDDPLLQSNWDDGEGYYKTRIGELIADRYRTMGEVGKGVFSTVIKCIDTKRHDQHVVLKIIRNNDVMRKASEKELTLLRMISDADPEGRKHCVRMLGSSEYRNHIVIAFEPLSMNLRETLKKFGKNVGINVTAVRMYARQLFVALRHLADLRIVHADIKPDNIIVSEDLKNVKLCDFGSAFLETDTDNDPTPYLVSRFYRAPEIILGLNYDRMLDLWSVGVCLYELFTGHVMIPGRSNNEMLKLMMEFKGKFPNKILRNSIRSYETLELEPHFDSDLKFKLLEPDPVTGKPTVKLLDIVTPTKEIRHILLSSKVVFCSIVHPYMMSCTGRSRRPHTCDEVG